MDDQHRAHRPYFQLLSLTPELLQHVASLVGPEALASVALSCQALNLAARLQVTRIRLPITALVQHTRSTQPVRHSRRRGAFSCFYPRPPQPPVSLAAPAAAPAAGPAVSPPPAAAATGVAAATAAGSAAATHGSTSSPPPPAEASSQPPLAQQQQDEAQASGRHDPRGKKFKAATPQQQQQQQQQPLLDAGPSSSSVPPLPAGAAATSVAVNAPQPTAVPVTASAQQPLHGPSLAVPPSSRAATHTGTRSSATRSSSSSGGLLGRLCGRFSAVRAVQLHHNSPVNPWELQTELQQLQGLTQLESLTLLDAISWQLPSELGALACLTQLTQLHVITQSPGMLMADATSVAFDNGLAFFNGALLSGQPNAAVQARLGNQLAAVSGLCKLRNLHLRCVCGERGFFTSTTLVPLTRSLSALTQLNLSYVRLQPSTLQQLAAFTALEVLIMYGDYVVLTASHFAELAPLRRLRRLELFHDGMLQQLDPAPEEPPGQALLAQVEEAFTGLTQLHWLNLPVTRSSTHILPLLHHLPALDELYLQNIDMSREDPYPADLVSSLQLGALRVLQVDNVRLSAPLLQGLAAATGLQQLILFNITPSQADATNLTVLTTLTNLRHFCFDGLVPHLVQQPVPALSDDTLRVLAASWEQLKSLHISFHGPSGTQMHLGALNAFSNLVDLSLSAARGSLHDPAQDPEDEPAVSVQVTIDCGCLPPELRSLCLNGVKVLRLYEVPPSVRHLWLSDAGLAPSDLLLLPQRTPRLQTLVVRTTALSDPAQWQAVNRRTLRCLGALTDLRALGLTLHYGLTDLRGLAGLRQLRRLVLDYDGVVPPGVVLPAGSAQALGGVLLPQLARLGAHCTQLEGLWLSDTVLNAGVLWQHVLGSVMPFVCVRSCANDWFWHTGFPIGSCLDVDNPVEWWRFTTWNIL